jgi:hypothetical protein
MSVCRNCGEPATVMKCVSNRAATYVVQRDPWCGVCRFDHGNLPSHTEPLPESPTRPTEGASEGTWADDKAVVPLLTAGIVAASVAFRYRNHRGEVTTRRVETTRLYWGRTEWHPEKQWLLDGWDHDKGAFRTFALGDIEGDSIKVIKVT